MAKQDSQSQLKRLKSALRDSGVSRDQRAKGPRKSRIDREKELAKIRDKFNPYETQINKAKFAVGGRKLKGTEGRPGASASIAEKMRQETIGRERMRKGRVGGLLDRRFGEGRADLTPEQIQLERYTRERQKTNKRHNFSLEDEDEEAGLTHLGQSLSAMDDFGPAPMSDDEDMGAEVVNRTNFGGFEDSQLEEDEIIGEDGLKRKKTKAEIMQEIIAKSKKGKYERQRQAEEDEEEREALDADLEDLQMLLHESQRSKPSATDGINSDRMKAIQEDSEYDKAVKELIFDRRAKASERTKTEEELVEEEAKRLHEQEEARMKRMRGEEDDEVPTRDRKRKRQAQGDDLSDDFQSESDLDEEQHEGDFGIGVNAAASRQVDDEVDSDGSDDGDENEDENDDDDSDEESSADEVQEADVVDIDADYALDEDGSDAESMVDDSDESNTSTDMTENELPSDELVAAAKAELARREADSVKVETKHKGILKHKQPVSIIEKSGELKFTYPCPSTLDQLLSITAPLAPDDVCTALHRIRVLHHPRLNPANNEKLSKYLTILIDYTLSPDLPATITDYCVGQIHDLSKKYWEPSTLHFLSILEEIRQSMYKRMTAAWQSREVRFFAMIGKVWSTSDAYHKVVTPSFLVIAQYLAQNSDASVHGKAVKVALGSILAYWVRDSKRYVPELMQMILATLRDTSTHERPDRCGSIDIRDLASADLASVSHTAELLLEQLAKLYISNSAFPDIFSPFLPLIKHAPIRETLTKAVQNSSASRRPLTLQSHRPIPLATYVPKFEESFNLDKKSYDRNADRASDSKMKAEIRDARRGAVRVLRRDAAFEARENAKERRGKNAAYTAKMKKVENRIRQKDD